jgi:ADP-ribose pyrophosphatase YjhB (NUDIX family)
MARGGHGRQRGRGGRRGQDSPRKNDAANSQGTPDGATGPRAQADRTSKATPKGSQKATAKGAQKGQGGQRRGAHNRRTRRTRWLRQVDEFSAGGLVLDLGGEVPRGALIARTDRHGRLLWSLPKGHIEDGETPEQAAVREVEEETGIAGVIVAELGTIDFWFVADGRRIHKTVRHYLMRATGGELSDADIEVTEVAWVPLPEIRAQLAYPDERGLVDAADRLLADTA